MSSCVKTSTTLTTPQVPAEENQPQSITLPPWLWCPGDVQCCRNYSYKVQHGPTCFLITWCTLLQNVFRVGWFMSCHYSPFSTRPLLARNSCSSPNAAVGLSAASRPVFPSVLEGYPGLGFAIYMCLQWSCAMAYPRTLLLIDIFFITCFIKHLSQLFFVHLNHLLRSEELSKVEPVKVAALKQTSAELFDPLFFVEIQSVLLTLTWALV